MKKRFFLFLFLLSCGYAEEWQRVYLASYPRSGNHWMRYLIEEATHIATSSVYRDPRHHLHLPDLFDWRAYSTDHGYSGKCRYPEKNESVVVKTHYPAQERALGDALPYVRAVHIVRHPIDALYSYYVDSQNGHPELLTMPKETLMGFLHELRRFETYWEMQENVLTIRYEDMMKDPYLPLKQVLEFIGYAATEEDLQRAITKYPPQGEVLKHLSCYPQKDRDYIKQTLSDFMAKHHYLIPPEN